MLMQMMILKKQWQNLLRKVMEQSLVPIGKRYNVEKQKRDLQKEWNLNRGLRKQMLLLFIVLQSPAALANQNYL